MKPRVPCHTSQNVLAVHSHPAQNINNRLEYYRDETSFERIQIRNTKARDNIINENWQLSIITCSAPSAPSDPLDPVLERLFASEAFFRLPFCGSSGGCCACGVGLGGFGGAISDEELSGLANCQKGRFSILYI